MGNRWPFALLVVVDLDHKVVTQHGSGLDMSYKYIQRIAFALEPYPPVRCTWRHQDGLSLCFKDFCIGML
jgi:hypothetical protein